MEQNIIQEENIDSAVVNNIGSLPVLTTTMDFEACCSIPGCITNTVKEVEDVSLFRPTIKCVNDWSSILGLQLTVNSVVCERHFRHQDILNLESLVNGTNKKVKTLSPYALPVQNNEVPVLRKYEDEFIRPIDNKTDEHSSEKQINNVLDNTDNCCIPNNFMSIDDSSINTSLSITLDPIEPHDSNLDDYSTRSIKTDVGGTEKIKREENGFIFEISKTVVRPSGYWKIKHLITQNETGFYQRDSSGVTVKTVNFYNSLVPIIQIYGINYDYNMPITSKKELEILLKKINDMEKCFGRNRYSHEKCIGRSKSPSEDSYVCPVCQCFRRNMAAIESKDKITESLKKKIAEMNARILKLRKQMAENKKKSST